jgi:selenocysteine lyase/cysteine desulfurase
MDDKSSEPLDRAAEDLMSHPYDIAAIRRQFPAAEKITYLDSGFQTPLSTPVKQAIDTFLHEGYESAGPKSVWLERVEATRSKVARFIGVSADEIAFTKNTSESMNIAANALPLGAGDSVLMIEGDHPNNAYAFLNLARKGVKVRFIPMTEVVAAETILPYIDATTRAVSMSQVTFHAGHLFDIESIGGLCAEMGLHFVVDVMQAIGVVPFDARKANATFAGCGTHKGLLVPQGLGLLYWNNANSEFAPAYLSTASLASPPGDLIARADHMGLAPGARRFELGNFNLPAIHALGLAIDFIESIGVADIERHCYELGDYLIDRLDAIGVGLVGPRARQHRSPHIYVIALPAAEWINYFGTHNVRVSPERDGVRVSLAMFNTDGDIDKLIDVIASRGITRPKAA